MILRGQIVFTRFPFDDFSDVKTRPVLCLTEMSGQNFNVIGAFITSQTPPDPQPTDIFIEPSLPEWALTGLKVPSVLRLHKMSVFDASTIQRYAGKWPAERWDEIETRLRLLFNL